VDGGLAKELGVSRTVGEEELVAGVRSGLNEEGFPIRGPGVFEECPEAIDRSLGDGACGGAGICRHALAEVG
jgi:hypothetical protein